MTASFLLGLDTTAPVVTWGPVDGAVASEEMTVPFTVNEPSLVSAELQLLDGRILPMVDGSGVLTVTLPADAPEGTATVRALVRDAVDNSATRTLAVAISGVLAETQPPPVPPSSMPRPQVVRVVSAPTRATSRSTFNVFATQTTGSSLRVRTRYTVPRTRTLYLTERARLAERWRIESTALTLTSRAGGGSSGEVIRRRPEGPSAEDDLIALDIL